MNRLLVAIAVAGCTLLAVQSAFSRDLKDGCIPPAKSPALLSCPVVLQAVTPNGNVQVAQSCAISEACFDPSTGKWNGVCPCDACAQKQGFC